MNLQTDKPSRARGSVVLAVPTTQGIVQKLWNLCTVLRDDGITYLQYVTELTYLLFLKMMKETGSETQIPKGYRWDDVAKRTDRRQLFLQAGVDYPCRWPPRWRARRVARRPGLVVSSFE